MTSENSAKCRPMRIHADRCETAGQTTSGTGTPSRENRLCLGVQARSRGKRGANLRQHLVRIAFIVLTALLPWSGVGNIVVFHRDPGSLAVGAVIVTVWCAVYARLWHVTTNMKQPKE